MTLSEFCSRIAQVKSLSNAQKAAAILWHFDLNNPGTEKTAGELAGLVRSHHIGNPNSTQLAKHLKATGVVLTQRGRFRLRQDKKTLIRSWFENVLAGVPAELPVDSQYLHEQVWKPTRSYIEKICIQLNGAYYQGFYDCAAVMLRRIVETLIIEAYEKLGRGSDIKGDDDNYFMLGKLVDIATSASGLTLGRESKKGLKEIKKHGDRSAHNRRYNAKKPDLDKDQDHFRLAFEELANLAGLYQP